MNTTRSTCWSLTIANPTAKQEEEIALARQKGWEVTGQKERGEGGLEHYQLMLKTPQVRFSAVKKSFATAHIEIARNQAALATYVNKEETRVGTLPKAQDKYPSLSKFWDLIWSYCCAHNLVRITDKGFLWRYKDDHKPIPLNILDDATRYLIKEGYHVEGIACNPSTRSAFKNYSLAILERCYAAIDRQTDSASEDTQSVSIPTINETSLREDLSGSGTDQEEDDEGSQDESSSDEGSYDSDQDSDAS